MSAGLFEETEIDLPHARYVNNNLAGYIVPVNADVPSVEIIMVPEKDDRVNPLGVKGIGEIGIVGGNAAVARRCSMRRAGAYVIYLCALKNCCKRNQVADACGR